MKKLITGIASLILMTNTCISQDVLCSHDDLTLDDKIILSSRYTVESNLIAYKFIKKIMEEANLPMDFVVQKITNARNAFAYMDNDGIRYILYDDVFLESLNTDSTKTEFITVLAHEIGHHLSSHTISIDNFITPDSCTLWCNRRSSQYNPKKIVSDCKEYLASRRNKESEADIFAGYILSKLGHNINLVKNTFKQTSSTGDDTFSTHPNLKNRLNSIEKGYSIAKSNPKNIVDIIQHIRGDSLRIDGIDYEKVKRNQIIKKIVNHSTHIPITIVSSKTSLNIDGSPRYYNHNKIDTINLFEQYFSAAMTLYDLDNIKIENHFKITIENKILTVKMIRKNKTKTLYTSIFHPDKISYQELTNTFVVIYESLIKNEMNKRR